MGLFNRFTRAPEPDPMAEAVVDAYQLGYKQGQRDGAVAALEAQADAIDAGLSGMDLRDDHPIRTLLLGMRRQNKETAAEIAGRS